MDILLGLVAILAGFMITRRTNVMFFLGVILSLAAIIAPFVLKTPAAKEYPGFVLLVNSSSVVLGFLVGMGVLARKKKRQSRNGQRPPDQKARRP